MRRPANPQPALAAWHASSSLQSIIRALAAGDIDTASMVVAQTSHQRLWRMLADAALAALKLDVAERAFAQCNDYAVW